MNSKTETDADALDGVGTLAREGEGVAGDELAGVGIDSIMVIYKNGDRKNLPVAAMQLDRKSTDLSRQIVDSEVESVLNLAYIAGAERGRDAVARLRAQIDELAEVFEERCLAYDAAASRCGKGETVSARQAWRWRSDLAFEVAEALNRLATPAQNSPQAAGNGAGVDFVGVAGISGRVSDKSHQAADFGRSTRCSENGQTTVVCETGPETAVEAAGGGEDV